MTSLPPQGEMGPAERGPTPLRRPTDDARIARYGQVPYKNRALDKNIYTWYHVSMFITLTRKQYRKLGKWAVSMLLRGGARLRVM